MKRNSHYLAALVFLPTSITFWTLAVLTSISQCQGIYSSKVFAIEIPDIVFGVYLTIGIVVFLRKDREHQWWIILARMILAHGIILLILIAGLTVFVMFDQGIVLRRKIPLVTFSAVVFSSVMLGGICALVRIWIINFSTNCLS